MGVTITGNAPLLGNSSILYAVSFPIQVTYLLVGGGGSSGDIYNGGGGGGGGQVVSGTFNITNFGSSFTITVGAGGIADSTGTAAYGGSGGNSLIVGSGGVNLSANGGGGGGCFATNNLVGGASGNGNPGGQGHTDAYGNIDGGGGGGQAAAGGNVDASSTSTGSGGNGIINPITGSTVGQLVSGNYYLGGGGYGQTDNNGSQTPLYGTSGLGTDISNSGGGASASGNGYSGVVVVSYTAPAKLVNGGIVTNPSSNYWIHTFKSSGTFSM